MTKTTKLLLGSIAVPLMLAAAGAQARETLNLADLKPGETRTIGEGAKQVTVSRQGDVATIQRPAADGERALSITCQLGSDSCRVVTLGDPEKLAIFVEKTRSCVNGVGDCNPLEEVDLEGLGIDSRIVVDKIVDCDGPGDCAEDDGGSGGVTVLHLNSGGRSGVLLRCPQGDTTMRVDSADADHTYFCPKHEVALERVRGPHLRSASERSEAQ